MGVLHRCLCFALHRISSAPNRAGRATPDPDPWGCSQKREPPSQKSRKIHYDRCMTCCLTGCSMCSCGPEQSGRPVCSPLLFFCSPTSRYEFNDTANTMSMPCASLSQRDDLRNGKPRQLRHPRTFQCLDAPTACGTPRAQGGCVVATASCCEGGVCHFA